MSDASPVSPGLLRAIFERSREAIGVSRAGVHVAANPAYLQLFGYGSLDELLQRPVLDLIAPDARPMILDHIRRRAAGDAVPDEYITRGLRKDGTEFDFSVRVSLGPAPDGGTPLTIVILQDVTEKLRAERELADSRAFYRAVFEVNTAVKLIIDPNGGAIVDANSAAAAFYGWSLDELRSLRISDINTLPPDAIAREMDAARAERRSYFRFRHRRKDGEVRDVEIYSGPLPVGPRRLLLSIVHDVTERHRLEERLQSTERMDALGRLAGGVAHDFNNLLAVMVSNADMLNGIVAPDAPEATYARRIVAAGVRADALTRRLLALARRQVLHPERVRVADVVLRIEDLLRSALGGTSLDVDVDVRSGFVWADASQIDQVLLNLATNARDACGASGHVCVRVYDVDVAEGDALVASVGTGAWVCLEMQDDGAGMDEATRARVFEPFFTTKPGVGTGLGLATAYGIVEQSQGVITVRSAPGQGTTFQVYLPRMAPAVSEPVPARIVVVEDERDLRDSLVDRLLARGHTVFAAADGVQAFAEVARAGAVDLIVCDVDLPGRSGPEVVRMLRQGRPQLRVLYVSGAGGGQELDGAPMVQKPFALATFDVAVDAALTGTRPPLESP